MDELARELASLGGSVVPVWTDARAERLLVGVGQLRRRRRAQRTALVSVVSLALVGLVYMQLGAAPQIARLNALTPGLQEPGMGLHLLNAEPKVLQQGGRPLQLADGSKVNALAGAGEASVFVEHNEAGRIGLRLDTGSAHFDVIPNPQRAFVVRAGAVEVSVLGTIFDVERAAGRVHVTVTRGKVRVRSSRQSDAVTLLMPGESAWFDEGSDTTALNGPAERASAVDAVSVAEREAEEAAENAESARASASAIHGRKVRNARSARHAAALASAHEERRSQGPRAAWRSLSQSGDYEGAYKLLEQESAVENDSGALLDAADAARLSGHPHAAVQYLRKVLDQHRNTPVAPLAAFTLGRVLLERLGQPSEAADAFATARKLAPAGSLAQDALAREVEAWSKAGHPDEAYRRAHEYIESYPHGRRLRSVQLYGGM